MRLFDREVDGEPLAEGPLGEDGTFVIDMTKRDGRYVAYEEIGEDPPLTHVDELPHAGPSTTEAAQALTDVLLHVSDCVRNLGEEIGKAFADAMAGISRMMYFPVGTCPPKVMLRSNPAKFVRWNDDGSENLTELTYRREWRQCIRWQTQTKAERSPRGRRRGGLHFATTKR